MFDMRHQDCIFTHLGYFPTIIAIASVPKSFRRKVKGKLEFIGDGVAHFEQSIGEGLVWEIVEGLVGRNEWVGSSELRKVSSMPPEGYHYLELFLPEWQNTILQCLGPNPTFKQSLTLMQATEHNSLEFYGRRRRISTVWKWS
jgi:hypothetical protein